MIREFKRASISGIAVAALVSVSIVLPYQLAAAGVPGQGLGAGSPAAGTSLVIEAKHGHAGKGKGKNIHVNKNIRVKGGKNWYVRSWRHKPYYGSVIAGVALGTLIGVTAAGIAPPPPAPNLCWYWSNPYRNQGYWDYCY